MNNHTVDLKILELLEQKYNIISIISFTDFDYNRYDVLESWIAKYKKEEFSSRDRFIVTHFDTDFYIDNSYGVTLNNFFNIWKKYCIPMYTLFFYTNHQGISKEIEKILIHHDKNDRPTVFETIINQLNYPESGHTECNIDVESIRYHGLFLAAGTKRTHRQAMYSKIQHLHPEKIAISIKRNN